MEKIELSVALNAQNIIAQVRRVVVGKDKVLLWILAAMLAKGHVLLEDIPGVGKTTMALAFSRTLDLKYGRMQFTPDVLPSDVTGYCVLNQADGSMTYREGAVLCNLFLADELNRATSRTQSALLEAMEEGQVTVDGVSHPLPDPFIVIATQNPIGAAGTQLLPDSQTDRFMVRLSLGYPAFEDELVMLQSRQNEDPLDAVVPIMDTGVLKEMQEVVAQTYVSKEVLSYALTLIAATRKDEMLLRGASPRASLALVSMSKSLAQLRGRDYVLPKDVQEVFKPTIAHRLLLSPKAQAGGKTPDQILQDILDSVTPPQLH